MSTAATRATSPRSTTEALVQVRGATKRFGSNTVLDGIDADIHRGEVVVIIGPSGAGKSTFLRCINGLERLDGGTVTIAGEQLRYTERGLNHIRSEVGMVFQSFNLFPHWTVRQNLMAAPIHVLGRPKDEVAAAAAELLDKVGLSHKADAYPESLSGGQQQRVAIARALAMDPQLMLFDEPTSALDPELVGEVLAVMRELATSGMTMAVVTHEMRFGRQAADTVLLMADGGIAEQGPPEQVLDDPQSERGRKFLEQVDER